MRYATEQDRHLAHLVTAVDLARQGCDVVESLEQAVRAAECLRALGLSSSSIGHELVKGLDARDAVRAHGI